MSRATIRCSGGLTLSCASTARTVRNTDDFAVLYFVQPDLGSPCFGPAGDAMTDRAQACRQRAEQCERAAPSLRERGRPVGAHCRSVLRVLMPPALVVPFRKAGGFFISFPSPRGWTQTANILLEDEKRRRGSRGSDPRLLHLTMARSFDRTLVSDPVHQDRPHRWLGSSILQAARPYVPTLT
jgi:hypothetical protein